MTHPGSRPYVWMLCGSFSFTLMVELAHHLTQVSGRCDWQTVAVFRAGLVGVARVAQPHLEAGNRGVYSALAAALFTAVAMLGLHSLSGIDPRAIVVHFSAVATVVCLTAFLVGPRSHPVSQIADATVV